MLTPSSTSQQPGSTTSGANEFPTRTTSFAIGARTLGGLRIDPATSFRDTRSFFTVPASATFDRDGCRLRFDEIGVVAYFTSSGRGAPATCDFFLAATVTDPRWHTANGLRIGARASELRRAFPRAFRVGVASGTAANVAPAATVWELTSPREAGHAARPVLVAYVARGSIAALGIDTVGH